MNKRFCNDNGNQYYILFGKIGERAFLCNLDEDQYVIVEMLEPTSWWHGIYYSNFNEAYLDWKGE